MFDSDLFLLCVIINVIFSCCLFLLPVSQIEYSETFRHFWGRRAFVLTHIAFFFCITCLNIASIVDTAQVVDQMISNWFQGGAIALSLSFPHYDDGTTYDSNSNGYSLLSWLASSDEEKSGGLIDLQIVRWNNNTCGGDSGDSGDVVDVNFDECIPFQTVDDSGDISWLLTLGYLIAACIFLPMSLKDLKVWKLIAL